MSDWLGTYREKGIARIPGVFSPKEAAAIRSEAHRALTRTNGTKQNYVQWKGGSPSLLFWPSVTSPHLDRVRRSPRLADIVQAALGDDVRQLNNQIYFRKAGDGDSFAWHRDIRFRPHIADPSAYLQTIIAIDEITADNGAVEFIEGSHRWPTFTEASDLRTFVRGDLRGTKYLAMPGDVLVWSLAIVHGSEPNTSKRDRMTYMNGFCRMGVLGDGWPMYLRGGEIVRGRPVFDQ